VADSVVLHESEHTALQLVLVVLQRDHKNAATQVNVLAREIAPSRQREKLRIPQGRLADAAGR
jgi:hypothetical protein